MRFTNRIRQYYAGMDLGAKVNKRDTIFKAAARLFALQGYDATTTLQVARAVGVTEPAVFYYFQNKNQLFAAIIEVAARIYLERLETLHRPGRTCFEGLEALIRICEILMGNMHFAVIDQAPEYMRILARSCPSRFEDQENACVAAYRAIRLRLKEAVIGILETGVALSEFQPVDIEATANMFIALLNGLMRQQLAALDNLDNVAAATIAFCKAGLMSQPRDHYPGLGAGCGRSAVVEKHLKFAGSTARGDA